VRDQLGNIIMWYGTDTEIEDRKATGDKLRRGEQKLRRFIDLIPLNIAVLDPSGNVVSVNRSTLDYAGLSMETVRAQTFREVVVHPRTSSGCGRSDRRRLRVAFPSPMSSARAGRTANTDGSSSSTTRFATSMDRCCTGTPPEPTSTIASARAERAQRK